jgi:hypothetical protein
LKKAADQQAPLIGLPIPHASLVLGFDETNPITFATSSARSLTSEFARAARTPVARDALPSGVFAAARVDRGVDRELSRQQGAFMAQTPQASRMFSYKIRE